MAIHAEFLATYERATQAALVAAASVYAGAIKEKLQHGYIEDSQYSHDPGRTGMTAASVQISEPFRFGEGGAWAVRVGSNIDFTLYWELGHFNLFLRRFVRVEHWRETLEEQNAAMSAAFADAFAAVMAGAQ